MRARPCKCNKYESRGREAGGVLWPIAACEAAACSSLVAGLECPPALQSSLSPALLTRHCWVVLLTSHTAAARVPLLVARSPGSASKAAEPPRAPACCPRVQAAHCVQAAGRCSPSPRRTAHPLTATATAPPPLAAAARSPAMQAGKIAVRVLSASGFRASPAASEQQQQQQQQLAPEAPVYLVCEVRRGAVRTMHCRHSFCSSPALLNPPIISRHRPASPRAAAGLRPPGDGAAQQGRGARQTHSV